MNAVRKPSKQKRKPSLKGTDALTFPFDQRDVGWAWTTATPLRPLVSTAERVKPLNTIPAHLHEHSDAALLAACRAAAKGEAFDFDLIQQRAAELDDGRRLGAAPHAALRDRMAHLRALLWLEEASTALDLEAADVFEVKLRNIQALPALTTNPYYAPAHPYDAIGFAPGTVVSEAARCTLTVPGANPNHFHGVAGA